MKLLTDALDLIGIEYTGEKIEKFIQYRDFILEWNEKVNLTTITDPDEFVKKHFVDSIVCAGYPEFQSAEEIIDVGTGAGFPGVPLAILNPDKKFLLLDSLNKRVRIIEEITCSIGIHNITFCHGRAEDIAQNEEHREKYDFCVSRAVANLAVLSEYCLPFVKVDGWFAAYKGSAPESEIAESENAIRILGGKKNDIRTFQMEGFDLDHTIVLIRKLKKTMAKYPRKSGMPAKQPLK